MTEQAHTQICRNGESWYATRKDFLKIFDEDLSGLYQLSFLLTGDHQKGEKCLVAGIEDCAEKNRVFMEWARAWAKRVIVKNAIRDLNPRPSQSTSSTLPTVFSHNQQPSRLIGHFHLDAVLGLADFERFVFVLCVLERYREYECARLLGFRSSGSSHSGCSGVGQYQPSRSDRYEDRERGRSAQKRSRRQRRHK